MEDHETNRPLPDGTEIFLYVEEGREGDLNYVPTGIRLVHRPTGAVVECTEHDTQIANRDAALAELEEFLSTRK